MKPGLLLSDTSGSIMWAGWAGAKVSIPLPRKPEACPTSVPAPTASSDTSPVQLPLPGQPVGQEPMATSSQVPMGPDGRPDINPYDRNMEMAVPLTFQSRSLGDVPLLRTADDRYFLSAEKFLTRTAGCGER